MIEGFAGVALNRQPGWVERGDTHHFYKMQLMGIASSTHPILNMPQR